MTLNNDGAGRDIYNNYSAIITKTLDTKPKAAWRSQDFTGYNQGEVIQEVYIRNIRNNAKTQILAQYQ